MQSRDRNSASKNYKSIITNLEFVSQGARLFLQTGNTTTLTLAERTLDWVLGSSGLADPSSGKIFDGMNVGACSTFAVNQWSYNYGELLGAFAWMHKAVRTIFSLDVLHSTDVGPVLADFKQYLPHPLESLPHRRSLHLLPCPLFDPRRAV